MLQLQIIFVGSSLLLILLSLPLMRGRVKPNGWYGFRTRRTINNPDIWYPVNAYAARLLVAVGLLTIAAAVILPVVPGIDVGSYGLAVSAVLLVSLIVALVMSFRYLNRLWAERS